MAEDPDVRRLRRERNILVFVATLMLAGAVAAALPRALARREELKATNAELLRLQAEIAVVQQGTRDVQRDILQAQQQIRAELQTR